MKKIHINFDTWSRRTTTTTETVEWDEYIRIKLFGKHWTPVCWHVMHNNEIENKRV